jgi:hypothetical protein
MTVATARMILSLSSPFGGQRPRRARRLLMINSGVVKRTVSRKVEAVREFNQSACTSAVPPQTVHVQWRHHHMMMACFGRRLPEQSLQ